MNSINWAGMFSNHENLQEMTTECINTITQIINKHAPKKQASLSKLKQLAKPWLSKGLIKSITTNQKLYRSHFLRKDPTKVSRYKTYSNRVLCTTISVM
jgi:arsenate reductase-like glutaredoxin family protein